MVNIISCNVRGLNAPNKQKEVKILCNEENVSLIGLLETKKKIDTMTDNMFAGWSYVTNLEEHYNGRIWITWRPDYYKVSTIFQTAQQIICEVMFIPLQILFDIPFVYAFNTKEERHELWESLVRHSRICTKPWMLLGDFNSILKAEDRIGEAPVVWSEIVDFKSCVHDCGLLEFPTPGNKYTWSDKHSHQRIFSRIDWIFINGVWLNTMLPCQAMFLNEGISDHCPAKVMLMDNPKFKSPFQFCNVWTKHPYFIWLVNEGWEVDNEGCMVFKVVKRLILLKRGLRKLHVLAFQNIVTEAQKDKNNLKLIQNKLHLSPDDAHLLERERQTYKKFRNSSYIAEVFLQQRSEATWIRMGDDNSRYLFSVIKHQKLKQTITQLKNQVGDWQTNPDTIASLFVDYYKELLGQRSKNRTSALLAVINQGVVLDNKHQRQMLLQVESDEVKEAIFQIKSVKSSGLDGYGSEFYKAAWTIFGNDVTKAVLEFFHNGKLLTQINSTSIALVPKVDRLKTASQFRPISCCHVIYKCISKIIYKRLRDAVNYLVAGNQSVFVKERSMMHNVLICHDLL
ncbi:hypothetical protein P3L10_023795 [Capsicum annuum]